MLVCDLGIVLISWAPLQPGVGALSLLVIVRLCVEFDRLSYLVFEQLVHYCICFVGITLYGIFVG